MHCNKLDHCTVLGKLSGAPYKKFLNTPLHVPTNAIIKRKSIAKEMRLYNHVLCPE